LKLLVNFIIRAVIYKMPEKYIGYNDKEKRREEKKREKQR
jgi:hypothetical protein